jgi:ribosomal 30S subunit maturation factor RimM
VLSRLIVEGPRGDVQVPFVAEICGVVDPVARRIVITPPEGLLELNG